MKQWRFSKFGRWAVAIWVLGGQLLGGPGAAMAAVIGPDTFTGVAVSYVLYRDAELLAAKEPDRRLPMASLTKMMTVLLVLEKSGLEEVVTVGPASAAASGSRLGLRSGERFTVIELLAAAMLPSANDACHALADHVAGGEAAFVTLMNRRAKELGMNDTNFANACGHDRPSHYATARDLARLAEVAWQQPVFARLAALERGSIETIDGRRSWTLVNSNAMLGRYP